MRMYKKGVAAALVIIVLVCYFTVWTWYVDRHSVNKAERIIAVLKRDAEEAERQAAAIPPIPDKPDPGELGRQLDHAKDRIRTWTEVMRELKDWVEGNLSHVPQAKRQELHDVWTECEARIRDVIDRYQRHSEKLRRLVENR